MICVGAGVWADATPESGVTITPESEIFDGLGFDEFHILRRPSPRPVPFVIGCFYVVQFRTVTGFICI